MGANGYLQKRAAKQNAIVEATQNIIQQLSYDCACIVLHREFGFGYDRVSKFCKAYGELYDEMFTAFAKPKSKTEDERYVYRVKLDKCLLEFIGDNPFVPFDERYPDAKKAEL